MHPPTDESVHEEMKSLQDITNSCVEKQFEQEIELESQNSKNSSTLQVQIEIEPEILVL